MLTKGVSLSTPGNLAEPGGKRPEGLSAGVQGFADRVAPCQPPLPVPGRAVTQGPLPSRAEVIASMPGTLAVAPPDSRPGTSRSRRSRQGLHATCVHTGRYFGYAQ